ncbi:MAG: hypothetical protein A2017_01030 [Lentisphaerae bacterium GWF2_44_16]|nr:MAG: hypothetical protein A2017_01030 [Lentisphaerae bacterium GWF2_44_16]
MINNRVYEYFKGKITMKKVLCELISILLSFTAYSAQCVNFSTNSAFPFIEWYEKYEAGSTYVIDISSVEDFSMDKYEGKSIDSFYVPEKALKAGKWYFKVFKEDKKKALITEGSFEISNEELIKFRLPQAKLNLLTKEHPRLKSLALASEVNKDEKIDELCKTIFPGKLIDLSTDIDKKEAYYVVKNYHSLLFPIALVMEKVALYGLKYENTQCKEFCKRNALFAAELRGKQSTYHITSALAYCYDVAWDIMNDEERAKVEKRLNELKDYLFESMFNWQHGITHNLFWRRTQHFFIAGAVLVSPGSLTEEQIKYILNMLTYKALPALGSQGTSPESLAYHSFGGKCIVSAAKEANELYKFDLFKHPWLQSAGIFPVYCAPPMGYAITFGDNWRPNHGMKGPLNLDFEKLLNKNILNPYVFWYCGIPEHDNIKAKAPFDIPQSIFYRDIGWCVFNTCLVDARENIGIAFKSGKYFTSHQHSDQNSLIVNAFGDALLVDGGYYNANNREYAHSSMAHNTLMINGKGQNKIKDIGNISEFYDSTEYGFCRGIMNSDSLYDGNLNYFERNLFFVKEGFIVICDFIKANNEKNNLEWLLHSQNRDGIEVKDQSFRINNSNSQLRGEILLPEKTIMTVESAYKIPVTDRYYNIPLPENFVANEQILKCQTKTSQKESLILAGMQIQKKSLANSEDIKFRLIKLPNAVAVEFNSYYVLFNKQSEHVKLDGIETNAESAGFKISENGELESVMLIKGNYFKFKNKDIFKSEQKINWKLSEKFTFNKINNPILLLDGKSGGYISGSLRKSKTSLSLSNLSGALNIDRNGLFSIQLAPESKAKDKVFVRIGQKGTILSKENNYTASIWLNSGGKLINILGNGDVTGVTINFISSEKFTASPYKVKNSVLNIEAINTLDKWSPEKAQISLVNNNLKKYRVVFSREGEEAAWELNIPSDGKYKLVFAGAKNAVFEIFVDGKSCGISKMENMEKEKTTMVCPELFLEKGKHTLMIKYLDGLFFIDNFLLDL